MRTLIATVASFIIIVMHSVSISANDIRVLDTITVGPMNFNIIELSYKEFSAENPSSASRKQTTTYPQIANPKNNEQRKWNEYIRSILPKSDNCDLDTKFSVKYVTQDIISIEVNKFRYCSGAPHGYPSRYHVNTVLNGDVMEIPVSELFNPDIEWKPDVFRLATENLETTSSRKDTVNYTKERLLRRYDGGKDYKFADIGMSLQGLEFNFGMVDGYAGGIFYAVVPWSELRPYLADQWASKAARDD